MFWKTNSEVPDSIVTVTELFTMLHNSTDLSILSVSMDLI